MAIKKDDFENFQEFQEPGRGAGDWIFEFGPIFMGVIFVLVIGTFLFVIVKGISQWSHNNKQPQLTVPADVKTKRSRVSGGANDTSARTTPILLHLKSKAETEWNCR